MTLITYSNPKILLADEGKHIREINDVYVPEHIDEDGNVVPEHFPYYSTVIFPGVQITTLEQCEELYIEENIE